MTLCSEAIDCRLLLYRLINFSAEAAPFDGGTDENKRLEKVRVVLVATNVVRIAGEIVGAVEAKDAVVAEVPGACLYPEREK